jgi:hypothetical protein
MALMKFLDWLKQQDESSAFTRLRAAAAQGLAPPIPDASQHSRSTFVTVAGAKKKKRKKRKKSD